MDDDESKIFNVIAAIQDNYNGTVNIYQASCVQEAIEVMQEQNIHLLISDLLMPIRYGESPDENGGRNLVRELYKRNKKVNVPIYIVGLTQYDNIKDKFSEVWRVWEYDSGKLEWKTKLKDLLSHIGRINSKIVKEKRETLFVEGVTDQSIMRMAFEMFFPGELEKLDIQAVKGGGGASWVERQLMIWGKSLHCKGESNSIYLRAVGLFDQDEPGLKAIANVRRVITDDSAENKTLAILKLDRKYARHLIPMYVKGIKIPVTLEEMLPPFCWEYALSKKWLVKREIKATFFVKQEHSQNFRNQSVVDELKLKSEELIYIDWKFNPEFKTDIIKYINGLDYDQQRIALASFEELIKEIIKKLWLNQNI
ncbi:hypothetical protein G6M26_30790 [Agrobacterium tumefaciens]|nr:hypothetical protein [Agrobacterium tumefaciens]NTE22939.1 hypothetical protein [Agrobacterium tumefaciens]